MNPKEIIKRIHNRLQQVYGGRLKKVILYGSLARGEFNDESDIDVLVILDEVRNYGRCLRTNIETLYPLAEDLGCRISAKPVSEKDYTTGDCPLYRNARREGIAA